MFGHKVRRFYFSGTPQAPPISANRDSEWRERRDFTVRRLLAPDNSALREKLQIAQMALRYKDRDVPVEAIDHLDDLRTPWRLTDWRKGRDKDWHPTKSVRIGTGILEYGYASPSDQIMEKWNNGSAEGRSGIIDELRRTGNLNRQLMRHLLSTASPDEVRDLVTHMIDVASLESVRSELYKNRGLMALGYALEHGPQEIQEVIQTVLLELGYIGYNKFPGNEKISARFSAVVSSAISIILGSFSLSVATFLPWHQVSEGVKAALLFAGCALIISTWTAISNIRKFRRQPHDYEFFEKENEESGMRIPAAVAGNLGDII